MMQKIAFLALFAMFLQGALGELVCEELPVELCSFSVATSGNRCLLETSESPEGQTRFQCKTSQVTAISIFGHIENDDCIGSCGVNRNSIGISSDNLFDANFIHKMCSPQCYDNCPNIVDLYSNLASAEGIVLDELCGLKKVGSRRSVIQLQSSSRQACAPELSAAAAPESSPFPCVGCAEPTM